MRTEERAREGKAKIVEATRASSKESRRGQAQREMVTRRQSTKSWSRRNKGEDARRGAERQERCENRREERLSPRDPFVQIPRK